jgi:electron transfer flavoprotein beta subunit
VINVLVCVKRVPATGGKIELTGDAQAIDTHFLKFTISPHEECALEEALRLTEMHRGTTTVLTLGPTAASEQLRDALALGIERAILLETDGREWDPSATAGAIVDAIRAQTTAGHTFNLLLFGNEAADTGDYQVGIRVAHALDWPCVTGVKALEIHGETVIAKREVSGGWEIFAVALPAVITVKEGINLPRYPSVPGRLKAKRQSIEQIKPQWHGNALEIVRLKTPPDQGDSAEILGRGPEVAAKVAELFQRLGMIER